MILYVNGDSHSAGTDLKIVNQSFPSLVARHFNLPIVNQSLPGGSNNYIIRITQDWIRTCNEKYFVLIGWTSWEREEWPYQGDFFQVNANNNTKGDKELDQQYRQWVSNLDDNNLPKLGQQWHESIWHFHQKLNVRGIPHLFFNFFYDFFVDKQDQMDWGPNFFHPYDSEYSYWHYLRRLKFRANGMLNFGPDAHRAWADVLIQHIKTHKLL